MSSQHNHHTDPAAMRAAPPDHTPPTRLRGHRVFAWAYARFSGSAERGPLGEARRSLVQQARGVTLDLGSGTGHNLPHFTDDVGSLHLLEPDPHMLRRLTERVAADSSPRARVHQAGAEDIPLPDASVDTVVSTLTLCSVQDPAAAASELRRVLKPTGRLLLLEHVQSSDPRVAARQERWDAVWGRIAGGCHLNRDTGNVLGAAGFNIEDAQRVSLPGPAVTAEALMGSVPLAVHRRRSWSPLSEGGRGGRMATTPEAEATAY